MRKSRMSKSQMRRTLLPDFWCSWGRHKTLKHAELKEQFPQGTICFACQWEITNNFREILPDAALTAGMERLERERVDRNTKRRVSEILFDRGAPDMERTGIVYYMRINEQIKIGYTTNLSQRSRNYPPGTELLAVEPADATTETLRHQEFQNDLIRGREWFRESDRLKRHIQALTKKYMVPVWDMHQLAKPTRGTSLTSKNIEMIG